MQSEQVFARFAAALAVIALLALSGCTHQARPGAQLERRSEPAADLVWPPAPDLPRIRHLHDISTAQDIGVRPGLLRRVVQFLKGEEQHSVVRPHGLATDAEGRLYVVDTFHRRVHVFDAANGTHHLFPASPVKDFVNPIGVAAGSGGRVYVSDSVTNLIHVFSSYGRRYEGSIGRGRLGRPTGLAFDAARQRLLVTDTMAASLVSFDAQTHEIVETVGGSGTQAFHAPTDVAIGKDGVVVSDSLNFRVQLRDEDLRFVRAFGKPGNWPGHFARPKGVAVDSAGHIYVVDARFGNVQVFNPDGAVLLAFGKNGTGRGEFWLPNDIAIDAQDRIYVSDAYNQRVQVFQYLHHAEEPL
jgi:DNA-binding beta-propeller fold protein YncE